MSSPAREQDLPSCKYGYGCYRQNPIHFKEYKHPHDYNEKRKKRSNESAPTGSNQLRNNVPTQSEDNSQQQKDVNKAKKLKYDNESVKVVDTDADSVINKSSFDSKLSDGHPLSSPFNFYLTKVSGIPDSYNSNHSSISINQILSPRFGRLLESAQFNYMHDIEWLMSQYHVSFRALPLLVVFGDKRDGKSSVDMIEQTRAYPNIKLCAAKIFDAYGTHHTKMMLLRYEDGMRVCIHTANLIHQDWHQKTQGVWLSPLFPLLPTSMPTTDLSPTQFKSDLLEYLNAYKCKEIDYWCHQIKRHDMSSAKVFLIASVPGRHVQDNRSKFGHLKLRKVLSSFGPSSKTVDHSWPVVCQFSSIGSLGPSPDTWLTGEFLCSLSMIQGKTSLMNMMKPPLKLIYPTVDNVRNSLEGYSAGASLPYSHKIAQKQPYLQSYLHSWKANHRGRSQASPHIKSYLRLSDKSDQISWFLLTSANLSKAAFGTLELKGTQLAIKSYELGVLFVPKMFESQQVFELKNDKIQLDSSRDGKQEKAFSFPIHIDLPLTPYSSTDEVWTVDKIHDDLPDCHGNAWIPG